MSLTARQEAFVREYLVDYCGKAAAVRAGYGEAGAAVRAVDLLKHPEVSAAIGQARKALTARVEASAERVVEEAARLAFAQPDELSAWGRGAIAAKVSALNLLAKHFGIVPTPGGITINGDEQRIILLDGGPRVGSNR